MRSHDISGDAGEVVSHVARPTSKSWFLADEVADTVQEMVDQVDDDNEDTDGSDSDSDSDSDTDEEVEAREWNIFLEDVKRRDK